MQVKYEYSRRLGVVKPHVPDQRLEDYVVGPL
jgi:hypothetical protein